MQSRIAALSEAGIAHLARERVIRVVCFATACHGSAKSQACREKRKKFDEGRLRERGEVVRSLAAGLSSGRSRAQPWLRSSIWAAWDAKQYRMASSRPRISRLEPGLASNRGILSPSAR